VLCDAFANAVSVCITSMNDDDHPELHCLLLCYTQHLWCTSGWHPCISRYMGTATGCTTYSRQPSCTHALTALSYPALSCAFCQAPLTSLKRHKLAVDVVGKATECGVVLDEGRMSDFQPGDVLECVEVVQRRVAAG
jgi:hypothetical protein